LAISIKPLNAQRQPGRTREHMPIDTKQLDLADPKVGSQLCCNTSGLPIRQESAWKDVTFGRDFRISLSVIGSNILLAEPKGNITLDDVKQYLDLIASFFEDVFSDGQVVFGLLDSTGVTGMTLEARRYYIEHNKAVSRFGGFVFFNASLVLKVSIQLAKHLNIFDFDVEIADDYGQAVKTVLQMMERSGNPIADNAANRIRNPEKHCHADDEPERFNIRKDPEWTLELDGFSVYYEIIDDDIFHTVAKGNLQEKHMPYVLDAFECVFDKTGLPKDSFYFVNGVEDLEGMTWKARKRYIEFTANWHKKHPYRLWFIYGANRFMRTAAHLGSYFVPYEVRIVDSLSGAFDIISAHKARSKTIPAVTSHSEPSVRDFTKDQIKHHVDELLQFLGGIDWESSGSIDLMPIDQSHPFKQVFEAIQVIKMDLDQLFQERKQLEERLQQAQKMEAIGTLAGGVAHDLNNILSGLVSYPELLLMDLPKESPYRKPIEIMKQSGERAAVIVQDLLTLARRGVSVMETLSVNRIISEYLTSPEMETLRVKHPRVRIETDLAQDIMNMQGSPAHLSKMIMNLISNALEAMPTGGKVIISTENYLLDSPMIGYEEVPTGAYVRLTVADQGIGMSAEVVARLFEPFFTNKTMGRTGTGLGMAVVWATVKDHGGYIDLHSKEKDGTTFWLYFPITSKALDLEAPAASVRSYMGNGESVLVVDDVAEQRDIASGILKRLGYRVHAVPSGEAAVEYLKKNNSDLLILDMIMQPGIDGLETYRKILRNHPEQKAIIASGYSETDRVRETLRLGAGSYIRKPYLVETVGKAVKAVLAG